MVNLIQAYAKQGDPSRARAVCDRLEKLDSKVAADLRGQLHL
jgi:pentatricopeptide repeat protein